MAAARSNWQITAICAARDENLVRFLASGIRDINILVEISAAEHEEQLRAATVYVVPVPETGASIGQIRIMNAADAGTPLIISAVTGIDAYASEDCVVQVTPNDPAALRSAVYSLLDDPKLQEHLRLEHFMRGSSRTMRVYLDKIADLVKSTSVARDGGQGRDFHRAHRSGK